jgi:trehalose 6-phosphate synthase/phosphatase
LREARPDAAIAASWTVPFAPPDVLRALPWAPEIVQGVLGADYVGVALPRDAAHLREAAAIARVTVADDGALQANGRRVEIGAIPLGCDAAAWAARGLASRGGRAIRLRRSLVADKLALAVDRVEKLRGVDTRLAAIERFFDRYPSWRGRLVFCQIAVPSRTRAEEYRDLKREIDAAVARVNTRFGDGNWQPVRYLYRAFEPDELAVYYAAADVALCTPLADGMSYVPLEYAATRTRDDGALIVSSLAGAADALPEAAQVNPYDEDAVAATVHDALEATPERAGARMRALRERVMRDDSKAFLSRFWSAAFRTELRFAVEPLAAAWPTVDSRQSQVSDVGSQV